MSEKLKNRQKTPNRHSFQKVFSGQQKSPKKHQIATSGSAGNRKVTINRWDPLQPQRLNIHLYIADENKCKLHGFHIN